MLYQTLSSIGLAGPLQCCQVHAFLAWACMSRFFREMGKLTKLRSFAKIALASRVRVQHPQLGVGGASGLVAGTYGGIFTAFGGIIDPVAS